MSVILNETPLEGSPVLTPSAWPKVTCKEVQQHTFTGGPSDLPFTEAMRQFEDALMRDLLDSTDRAIMEGTPTVEPLGIFEKDES